MLLTGKNALVTGGGRGIGRGITEKLLAAGARVLVAQRQALDADLADNPNLFYVEANLADSGAPADIARAASELLGGVDVLVNNAGLMFEQPIEEMSEQDWDRMMILNLRAPVFLARELLGQMRRRGGGSIINIGSIEGLSANPEHAAYCASKAGLHGLTRALAVDLGRDGIRCNAIAPGWIDSDLSNAYIDAQRDPAGARLGLLAMHPVGRTGAPQDIGGAVVFLASDEAAFITGQVLVIDGGRTAKLPLPF
ncbi:glucose 1-dehydrogenase [Pseudomonas sp. KB-10]|uniref:SDR family NAD(P)-dependent oxidoreductase n=1 Tax=Pseudomonas sp. KB-10 TaxID=2292264 RepID=UPI001BAEBB52|nr:glucose 1-dehydrogenase [Pseudomonas sp. KB-10]